MVAVKNPVSLLVSEHNLKTTVSYDIFYLSMFSLPVYRASLTRSIEKNNKNQITEMSHGRSRDVIW